MFTVSAWAVPAWAGPREDYAAGIAFSEAARFEQAISPLRKALGSGVLSAAEQKRGRLALAQSLFYASKPAPARTELKLWLKQFPNDQLDEAMYPPDFVAFFKGVHDEVEKQRRTEVRPAEVKRSEPVKSEPKVDPAHTEPNVVEPRMPETKVSPPKPAEPSAVTAEPKSLVVDTPSTSPPGSAPWYLKILPFGVGQFANGDTFGGGIWLGVELALLAGHVSIAVYNQTSLGPDGGYPAGTQSRVLYVAQNVSAGLLIATCVMGVVDAFVWSPDRAARAHVAVGFNPINPGVVVAGTF